MNDFSLEVLFPSDRAAQCAAKSLGMEFNQPFEKRSRSTIQCHGSMLSVRIRSAEERSLRASVQSNAKLAVMLAGIEER